VTAGNFQIEYARSGNIFAELQDDLENPSCCEDLTAGAMVASKSLIVPEDEGFN
jgi:hypothetical protein